MKKNNQLVSVLMPAYNAEKYIAKAINSILNQTFKNFELIVINDCSTDGTREIIRKYTEEDSRVILIDNKKNLGIANTLNKGLNFAHGELIARLDSDDYSYPERLEKQVAFMENNPKVVLSSSNMFICDKNLKPLRKSNFPLSNQHIKKVILQYNPMVSPAMIWRKNVAEKIGGFSTESLSEDYLFLLQMSAEGELANLQEPLIKYRVLSNSHSSANMQKTHLSTLQIGIIGHLRYRYPLSLKTKLIMLIRLFVAYFVPRTVWKFISTLLRR